MAYKWIRKAQENGAKIIHVDPRFTRTSAGADVYARIRPGHRRRVPEHDDQPHPRQQAVRRGLRRDPHERPLPGRRGLRLQGRASSAGTTRSTTSTTPRPGDTSSTAKGKPRVAKSLDDPHCVFTRLKTFVSRYTLEMGEQITGIPAAQIQQIAETMAKNRPGAILYALGMTQHTTGVQGIRSFTILQLLLGNIGKPGGGVNALRGEPNVQGACDMAVLYNYMPGYLNSPSNAEPTIYDYVRKNGIADSRYLVNTLKAFFGDAATKENDYAYAWLPKRNAAKDYGTLPMFEDALAGKLKLLWIVGQNPAVTMPNLKLTFDAMAQARDARGPGDLGDRDGDVLEAARASTRSPSRPRSSCCRRRSSWRRTAPSRNSGGMVQWRHAAVKPPGQAKPDGEIVDYVFRARARPGPRLEGPEGRDRQQGLLDLHHGRGRPARDQRLRRCATTRRRASRRAISSARSAISRPTVRRRPAPGSTRASSPTARTSRSAATRRPTRGASASIRASAGPGPTTCASSTTGPPATGTASPTRARKPIVWWDEQAKRWTGYDVPDVPVADRRAGHAQRAARLPPGRGGRRAALRGRLLGSRREDIPGIRATWPTCRRTARCRRCTSPSRARWRTSSTRR